MQEIVVPGGDGPISVELFTGGGNVRRPAVIILHGRQSIEQFPATYMRYAGSLASKGLDAFLVSYYIDKDAEAMDSPDRAERTAYLRAHLAVWADRVRDVVGYVLARHDSSGKVGLLGFSNGGLLAVASAASDPRVSALVVFYGGLSGPAAEITHLPPLLALHGDADRVIPLSASAALVERAQALGGQAQLITYAGAGHGFDFDPDRADARDALNRAVTFLEQQLK